MNAIRVKHVRDFKGEDVVLLAMDGAGLATFLAALRRATRHGSGRLQHRGRVHDFVLEAGAADVALTDDRMVWQLDRAMVVEIIET